MSVLESTAERLLEALSESVPADADTKPRHKTLRRAAYAAGALAAVTAASAGISSLRDRLESSSSS